MDGNNEIQERTYQFSLRIIRLKIGDHGNARKSMSNPHICVSRI